MLILPISLSKIGFDAFAECTALSRIALPRGVREIEDGDIFRGCDKLAEISFGGSKEGFELLFGTDALTIEHSDGTVSVPRVSFLEIKNEI